MLLTIPGVSEVVIATFLFMMISLMVGYLYLNSATAKTLPKSESAQLAHLLVRQGQRSLEEIRQAQKLLDTFVAKIRSFNYTYTPTSQAKTNLDLEALQNSFEELECIASAWLDKTRLPRKKVVQTTAAGLRQTTDDLQLYLGQILLRASEARRALMHVFALKLAETQLGLILSQLDSELQLLLVTYKDWEHYQVDLTRLLGLRNGIDDQELLAHEQACQNNYEAAHLAMQNILATALMLLQDIYDIKTAAPKYNALKSRCFAMLSVVREQLTRLGPGEAEAQKKTFAEITAVYEKLKVEPKDKNMSWSELNTEMFILRQRLYDLELELLLRASHDHSLLKYKHSTQDKARSLMTMLAEHVKLDDKRLAELSSLSQEMDNNTFLGAFESADKNQQVIDQLWTLLAEEVAEGKIRHPVEAS